MESLNALKSNSSLSFTEVGQVLDNSTNSVDFSLNFMGGNEKAGLGVLLLLELLVVGLVLGNDGEHSSLSLSFLGGFLSDGDANSVVIGKTYK